MSISNESRVLFDAIMNADCEPSLLLANEGAIATQKVIRVTLSKQTIIDRKVSRMALFLAREQGDVMYDKYRKFFLAARTMRDQIRKKYGMKAKSLVMRGASAASQAPAAVKVPAKK